LAHEPRFGPIKLKPHARPLSTDTPAARLSIHDTQTPASHPRRLELTLARLVLEPAALVVEYFHQPWFEGVRFSV
jgi:hypothetical protein